MSLYNPTGTPITPNKGWGNTTTFGECVPSFTILTPTSCVACVDSNMTPGATLDTFSANGGTFYRVFRSVTNPPECRLVRAVLPIIVQDLEPPTFMPACPKGNRVNLNAGPGECTVSWDAPRFMAMDNCPAASFFSGELQSVGCTGAAQFASVSGAEWGYLFNITNTGSTPVNIRAFESYFHSLNTGIGNNAIDDQNGQYEFWYKTTPNTDWKAGWVGGIPNNTCNFGGSSPKALWTLGAATPANSGIRTYGWLTPPAAANRDTFNVATNKFYDTIQCPGSIFVDSSRTGGKLTLMPGETRGIGLYAKGGSGDGFILANFGGCSNNAGYGNATLKMNTNPSGVGPNAGVTDYAGGSAPFAGNLCAAMGYQGNILYAATNNQVAVVQTCGQPYGPGCFFPIGCTRLCYRATDAQGNVAVCDFDVCVNAYANPSRALACNDEIQISLDQNCSATINADMVLEGGPYGCYDNYIVEARYWTGGGLIDRNPNLAGTQINGTDIGKELKITVRDPVTGNSCWGHATVEDKIAPRLTCPANATFSCAIDPIPANTGVPSVVENCGGANLSYRDNSTQGNCALGYSKRILRTWTAVDGSGNRATCVQTITLGLGDLFEVTVPPNYDNIDQPMLACDAKIDRNKNVTPHMADFPECVDGYILDSAFWLANPNQPDQYPNRRLPRVLGWNCIDDVNSPWFGHPNPDPVYYPSHRQWSQTNPLCWGPNRHIMWVGTGKPGGAECFNLSVTYKDIVFNLATPGCDAGPVGCYKVLRQWTVMDWCTSVLGGHNQIIKVTDTEGPQVLYPDSARVNMESYACVGRWEVPPAWIIDNCSNEVHYTVEVEQGVVLGDETSGYVVVNMPEGIQIGYINAIDCCGNITKKRVVLNVVDRVPPQAICRSVTTVSINGNQTPGSNLAKVCAESFDEGSFDNCQPHIYFKVIRMAELLGTNNGSNSNNVVACNGVNGDDNSILAGNQVYFDDCTYFCCADVGTKVMVVLRVFDVDPGPGPVTPIRMTSTSSVLNGRFSDCMVEVEVQDKSVPTVVAPPNMVVSCWYWFDITKLTDPNDATFGRVVTNLSDRKKVVTKDLVCYKFCERNDYTGYPGYVQTNAVPKPAPNQACEYYYQYFDTAHWDRKYELVWGFDGYVLSGCGSAPTITVNDLRECGQGVIQRIVSTQGPNNINVTAIQTIWFVDCDPFYVDDVTCNDPRYTDLMWPNGVCTQTPVTIDGCGADISPDNPQLGRPQVINNADDNCALLSIEYFDEIFNIEPDACFKVLRRWVVIDWCQYDPFIDPNFGRWEALQVIKVRDQDRPVVTCNVGPCEPAVIDPVLGVCVGHISLTADATDNCSPLDWLFWEYKIDAYNDGKGVHGGYDFRVGTLTQRQYNAGDTVEYSHNPFADDNHNPFNASGTYPIGIHKIKWFVEDGCGNVGVCESLFEIKDCKAPTPYCLTGVITVPMPASGCVEIWAKDLDHGSYDNCTAKENLKFYFDGDDTKTFINVCCADFVAQGQNDELRIEVEMWVEDEEGNKDYCKTVVIVQDNQDICPNTGSFGKITGNLKTEGGDVANPVDMQLYNNGNMMAQRVGSPYSFGDLKLNVNYMVSPNRNDEHNNGITTQDIVKIQKHILGQTPLNSAYKLIAADVNNSGSVTAADMSELRKLILGLTSEFSKVKSWTFVPAGYVFPDANNPWNAPRTSSLMLDNNKVVDFVAVKMGDVTNDARASNASNTQSRTNGVLNIEVDEKSVVAGESYKVSFKSSDFNNISGYQFTLKYDKSSLIFEGMEGGVLKATEANFGTNRLNEGIITTSWNSNKGESFGKDAELFTLVFKATRNGKVSQMFAITSDVTKAQAYNASEEVKEVRMGVRTDKGVVEGGVFELYQNEPNPFSKETVVKYRLPEASAVKLTVYDVTGKVVRVYELKGQKRLEQLPDQQRRFECYRTVVLSVGCNKPHRNKEDVSS
ncbi:MAG: hypothetical protein IPO72_00940 [Saprospiraceae bacterium]|nr:hypothetical protein [Candidatus Vicinibacter affinis]